MTRTQTTTIRMRRPYRAACRQGDEVIFKFVTRNQRQAGLVAGLPYLCIDNGHIINNRTPCLLFTCSFLGNRTNCTTVGFRPIKGQLDVIGYYNIKVSDGITYLN